MFSDLSDLIFALGLSAPRIAAAFLILPLLTQETVPALVRNVLFVSLALIVVPLTSYGLQSVPTANIVWPFIVMKELFIGASIGFLFGAIFWAVSIAGGVIDTQAGANMANAMDPVQGHQSSPNSRWLAQFASWLFMVSGGLLIFVDLLLTSYQLYPVTAPLPSLSHIGMQIYLGEFNYIMTTALLLAAPVVLLLALVDLCFGLVNRFAQELNVLSITMPVKSWVAVLILMLNLGLIVEIILRKLMDNKTLLNTLEQGLL